MPAYETSLIVDSGDDAIEHHSVHQVTTKYLAKLKETAESYLSAVVGGCIISIPAHFDDMQKTALLSAAKDAGFTSAIPIHEPVAACLAFDPNGESLKEDKEILVLDLGAHQFNVTHISYHDGLFQMKESIEFDDLGGIQFDLAIVEFAKQEFQRKYKVDISSNQRAMQKLTNACERTKRALTRQDTAPLSVDSLHDGIDYTGSVNRNRFEMLSEGIYQKCKDAVFSALVKTKLTVDQVDQVLLIGGSSRMPRFQAMMKSLFPESVEFRTDVEPDEAISIGCAMHARIMNEHEVEKPYAHSTVKAETLSQAIGVVINEKFVQVIPIGTPIPVRRQISFSIKDSQTEAYLCVHQKSMDGNETVTAELVLSELENTPNRTVDVVFVIENAKAMHIKMSEKSSGQTLDVIVE